VSRRHHGGRPHRTNGHAPLAEAPRPPAPRPAAPPGPEPPAAFADAAAAPPRDGVAAFVPAPPSTLADTRPAADDAHRHDNGSGPAAPWADAAGPEGSAPAGCTAPQLRRFIKSRPYVPMHELRRRFGINGPEDDVTPVDLGAGRIFVGLPAREGALLGELLRGGEIGYELSLDPRSPVVVGLYPMRPVARS
jgi:hypothetical protein